MNPSNNSNNPNNGVNGTPTQSNGMGVENGNTLAVNNPVDAYSYLAPPSAVNQNTSSEPQPQVNAAPVTPASPQAPVAPEVPVAPIENANQTVGVQPSTPVQPTNTTIGNTVEPNQQAFGSPMNYMIEEPKKKKSPIFIILIIVVIGAVGYFVYPKVFNTGSSGNKVSGCIDDLQSEGSMSTGDMIGVESGDTQYIFDSRFNSDFISKALKLDDVKLKICYSDAKNSDVNFTVGEATKTKKVESYELYNKTTNAKMNATNLDDLFKELGYHAYGKYNEKATVVDFSTYPSYGFAGDKTFISYDITIKFSNNKTVEAKYYVYENQKDRIKEIVKNKQYTFDFETKEDTFEPIVYTITDFK